MVYQLILLDGEQAQLRAAVDRLGRLNSIDE